MATLAALILGAGIASSLALSGNQSICLSNRGRPLDKDHCQEFGEERGCIWQDGQCVCENGGVYAKSSHKCWPPGSQPSTRQKPTTFAAPTPAIFLSGNDSVCVSNHGLPYDEYYCNEQGKKWGCLWKDGQCVCANGGYYAKSSHTCWPPTATTTQAPTTSATTLVPSFQNGNESTCVSNRGIPYDEYYCSEVGKKRGCVWKDGHCMCENGGYYAKSHLAWSSLFRAEVLQCNQTCLLYTY